MHVVGVDNLPVCGNGVCEAGEMVYGWQTAPVSRMVGGPAWVDATTLRCPQDCPVPFGMCMVASDGGAVVQSCSGRGRCLPASNSCMCFEV